MSKDIKQPWDEDMQDKSQNIIIKTPQVEVVFYPANIEYIIEKIRNSIDTLDMDALDFAHEEIKKTEAYEIDCITGNDTNETKKEMLSRVMPYKNKSKKAKLLIEKLEKLSGNDPIVLQMKVYDENLSKTETNSSKITKRIQFIFEKNIIAETDYLIFSENILNIDKALKSVLSQPVIPDENIMIMLCDLDSYSGRASSFKDQIFMNKQEVENFIDLYQVYIHERVHMPCNQIKPDDKAIQYCRSFHEGLANYLAVYAMEYLNMFKDRSDSNLRQQSTQIAEMGSELLERKKNNIQDSGGSLLRNLWLEKEESNEGLHDYHYEFGQTLVEVLIDEYDSVELGIGKFIELYKETYKPEYKDIKTLDQIRSVLQKQYKNKEINDIFEKTFNRLLLKSMKGKKLFNYLIKLEIDKLKIILQNQKLHVVLGILRNSSYNKYEIEARVIKRHLKDYDSQHKGLIIHQFLDHSLEKIPK
ncbi:hypothetical protein HON22_01345 [Candidatus Peregrinibacteria bacterium]|nr:hypothetical protein [Candidatus Peregrinibacteria bacterium]